MSSNHAANVPNFPNTTSYTESDSFARRHLGIGEQDAAEMAAEIGFDSLDRLIDDAVPENIRISTIDEEMELPKTQ